MGGFSSAMGIPASVGVMETLELLLNALIEIHSAAWTLIGFPGGKHDDISQYRLTLWAPYSDVHKYVSDKEQGYRAIQECIEY